MEELNKKIERLLKKFEKKEIKSSDLVKDFKEIYYEDVGFAKIDHHRSLRRGFPEVIYGQGKTPEQIKKIAKGILKHSPTLLVTRTDARTFELLSSEIKGLLFDEDAKIIYTAIDKDKKRKKGILVICAGTSDIPVAQEASITSELMGFEVERVYDVGVAGIHRLLSYKKQISEAKVIVAVAGMEGALPSVVSSLTKALVIAVPTSIGYGASLNGISPLLTMLNSCSPGIVVVNIDNGFGAGYSAGIVAGSNK